jgi:predicted nucleic acid-binding protein
MILVMDACAFLLSDKNTCIIHALNLCEVYYDLVRSAGEDRAKDVINRLVMAGVFVRDDLDTDFWQDAGNIKTRYARVSLADCLCIALANRLGADVLTADHHEFDALVQAGLCRARFIH